MKRCFTKTILASLIISMISMLSGFCIFPKISVASAAIVDHGCGGAQPMEKDSAPALSGSANHNQNSLLPCCIDGRHDRIAIIVTSVESGQSMAVAFLPQSQPVMPSPRIVFTHNTSVSPPKLSLIKTTVLRL